MKYYIRVYTGLRKEQYQSIPMQEAHKAYYLFSHPEERGIFENGVAMIGKNIQEIRPDWNATMGWNPTHDMQDADWNVIRNAGVDEKMQILIKKAKEVALLIENNPELAHKQLVEAMQILPEEQVPVELPAYQEKRYKED